MTMIQRAHWSFWLIAVVMLIWNGLGVVNYFVQMNSDFIAQMSDVHRAIIVERPGWATGGFAIAVVLGTLGSLLLLFKKSIAYYLFIASLVGVLVTMVHTIGVAMNTTGFGVPNIIMMIVMPIVVAIFLIWYVKMAEKKGWIH